MEALDKDKQYYYFDKNLDKAPVPVKLIQENLRRGRVEVSRELDGEAGFWINRNQLLTYEKAVLGKNGVEEFYLFVTD